MTDELADNAIASAPHWSCCTSVEDVVEIAVSWSEGGHAWWRGEPEHFSSSCVPTIARTDEPFDRSKKSSNLTVIEQSVIEGLRRRDKTPKDAWFRLAAMQDPKTSAWWAYAQHQGEDTRLLDITKSPLVALYFAAGSPDNEPGFLLRMNAPGSMDSSGASRPSPSATYEDCFDWRDPELPEGENPWSTFGVAYPNDRLLAQNGGFIWSPKLLPNEPPSTGAIKFRIPAADKPRIRSQLAALGITERQLFPPKPDFLPDAGFRRPAQFARWTTWGRRFVGRFTVS